MQDIFGQMIQYGIRFDQRALRKFFREYEVGALEALLGDLDRDEAQVNRENRRMYQGDQSVRANQNVDNHEAHVAGHREEMKTAQYEQAVRENPSIAAVFEAHLKEHLDIAAQQAMPPIMPGPNGEPVPTGDPTAGAGGGQPDLSALLSQMTSA
jgi:hypothetical protein